MPLYEYRCESCQHQFEVIRKFSDPPLETCPSCGAATVVKLLSSPAFQFKGTGWYITDYARKDSAKSSGEDKDGKSESKSEGKSDAKSDTKADSKSDSASGSAAKDTSTSTTPASAPKSEP
jgi:putative FmdB family regulatory protein